MKTKNCGHCGVEFTPANGGQKYCNGACAQVARIIRARKNDKLWRMRNVALKSVINRNDLARRRGATGSYTVREFTELCNHFNNRCAACGEAKPLTADHVIPVCRGGDNYIGNIQPLCGDCNSIKGVQVIDYRDAQWIWTATERERVAA